MRNSDCGKLGVKRGVGNIYKLRLLRIGRIFKQTAYNRFIIFDRKGIYGDSVILKLLRNGRKQSIKDLLRTRV